MWLRFSTGLPGPFARRRPRKAQKSYRIVHGDVNPMQIFVHDEQAYFVDFDGVCLSHPALDVSNFLIALKVRFPQMANELTRYFLENYLHRCPSAYLRGLRIYHALIYFRRAMIAFRQKRHSYREKWVHDLLQKANSYLNKKTAVID
ncbi:MAG: phosphotransferase [candidate division KSB1 bacterium]|nr:phosphotransferase [candidate division KSB1 bacterium]